MQLTEAHAIYFLDDDTGGKNTSGLYCIFASLLLITHSEKDKKSKIIVM